MYVDTTYLAQILVLGHVKVTTDLIRDSSWFHKGIIASLALTWYSSKAFGRFLLSFQEIARTDQAAADLLAYYDHIHYPYRLVWSRRVLRFISGLRGS